MLRRQDPNRRGSREVLAAGRRSAVCACGGLPYGSLAADSKGNLYGTTYGGDNLSDCEGGGCGAVFELSPKRELTVLHSFTDGADGARPRAGVILDAKGIYTEPRQMAAWGPTVVASSSKLPLPVRNSNFIPLPASVMEARQKLVWPWILREISMAPRTWVLRLWGDLRTYSVRRPWLLFRLHSKSVRGVRSV